MSTATDMRDLYLQAEQDILRHGQSTAFAGRTLTTADLPSIRAGRKEWEARAAAESRPAGAPSFPHSLASMSTR